MPTHNITDLPRRSKLAVMKARVDHTMRTNPNAFIASRVALMVVLPAIAIAVNYKLLAKDRDEDETTETPED